MVVEGAAVLEGIANARTGDEVLPARREGGGGEDLVVAPFTVESSNNDALEAFRDVLSAAREGDAVGSGASNIGIPVGESGEPIRVGEDRGGDESH